MNDILTDLSPARLSRSIEENLYSWIPVMGAIWEARSDDPQGVKRSLSPVKFPLFNSVMDTHLDAENVEQAIQRVKSDAETRNVAALWWVGPSTQPADMGQRLTDRGFAIDDDGPGMAADLLSLADTLPAPDGLSIQRVQDDGTLREWSVALGMGFEAPNSLMDYFVDAWTNFIRQVDPDTTQAYLARLNGQPVATSIMQFGAGVTGIYAVSTIPSARRQGIGAQVTLEPLLRARSKGYRVGVLQASEMGHKVYQSIGFRDYCRITSYVYRPILSVVAGLR